MTTRIDRWHPRRDDDGVATARFEDEAVLYEIATSSLHRLNATAAAVWDACDGTQDVDAIVAALATTYPQVPVVEVAAGVHSVLEELAASGLVTSPSVEQLEHGGE